jgi:hypothetical protein
MSPITCEHCSRHAAFLVLVPVAHSQGSLWEAVCRAHPGEPGWATASLDDHAALASWSAGLELAVAPLDPRARRVAGLWLAPVGGA